MSEVKTHLTEEIRSYIGMETEVLDAFDPVERGAVRRFAQAIMDPDPVFMEGEASEDSRYGGPVAPPLFPLTQHRLPFGAPDFLTERAEDPDFDGTRVDAAAGEIGPGGKPRTLPPLPLGPLALLNGGSEIELYRYLRHGESLSYKSRYADIFERETSKGLMVFVVTDIDYLDKDGALVARVKRTTIRR
jgi:hypothetical protein